METTSPAAPPASASLADALVRGVHRRPADLAAAALLQLAGGASLLAALAAAYTAKRRLGIDVFPGVDMLPDPQIEAAIGAALRLFDW
jgi:hypothetical protein